MSLTMAEKYVRRTLRLQRASRALAWFGVLCAAVAIPMNLYSGEPLTAIACVLSLWVSGRILAEPRITHITITFDVDTSGFDAAMAEFQSAIELVEVARPSMPCPSCNGPYCMNLAGVLGPDRCAQARHTLPAEGTTTQ